jgi:hypothetical protein
MRVFVTKWFAKFASGENLFDQALCSAAAEVAVGIFEADLEGSLYKKRVARDGGGKSGGYRPIVGYKDPHTDGIVFVFGFPKSHAENITNVARDVFSVAAKAFIKATYKEVTKMIAENWNAKDCRHDKRNRRGPERRL